jgi:hypothetical protein
MTRHSLRPRQAKTKLKYGRNPNKVSVRNQTMTVTGWIIHRDKPMITGEETVT